MHHPGPILIVDLLPRLDQELISLLQSLSPADWARPTIAGQWTVKDVAGHLLDGNIRGLSMARDGYFGEKPEGVSSYRDLVDYLNLLNADWIRAMKRVSPQVLVELLERTGEAYTGYLQTLDPFAEAIFSVAWAGEQTSANWFHIAREYTEKWHHQQQIRLAVGQTERLYQKDFYLPHLDTSMRALPHHYRHAEGRAGDLIRFTVTGCDESWFLHHTGTGWQLVDRPLTEPVCVVVIAGEVAWRLFTKGISRQEAEKGVIISGRYSLGAKIFDMLAVMAV